MAFDTDPGADIWRGAAAFRGVVRNGVIVLDPGVRLQDGDEVLVMVPPLEMTAEERAEFEAWDRLSDEAWAMIDEMERESGAPRPEDLVRRPEGASGNSPG
jgi:hypothetical protein